MLFNESKNVLCIATKQDTAKNMVTKVTFMYNNLPSWLREPIRPPEENKLTLKFNNGSQIKAVSAAEDSGRSEAVSLLLIDEAAFIEGVDKIWASAQQTLATGGGCIAMSTPYGTGNWFHRTWVKAELNERDNQFLPIKLPWYVHPERDEEWRRKQDELLGDPRIAAQECFSGDTIIYTKYGPKEISEIKRDDLVLSHDGTFNKVKNIFSHKSENLYEIKNGLNNIKKYVTGNHPFLNKNNKWEEINSLIDTKEYIQLFPNKIEDSLTKKIDLLEYIKAENPKYFPLKYDENYIWLNKKSHINRFIEFDYKLGFILGCYLSEGSYWKNVVSFTYNWDLEKETWPLFLENLILDKFNITIFSHYKSKRDKAANLYIKNQIFKKFIELCLNENKYCQYKNISKFVYENSNKETLKGILDGMISGDGMLKKEYNCNLCFSNGKLIYDALYIANMLGIHNVTLKKSNGGIKNIIGKDYNVQPNYILTFIGTQIQSENKIFSQRTNNIDFNQNGKKITKFKYENKPLTKLKLKKIENKEINVFNFEVENTNTYVTEFGIVHNCDAEFSTSGDTVFYSEILQFIEQTTVKDPLERRGVDKNLWIWEYPDYSKNYAIIADVARGDGKDYSSAHVIDIETNIQVAEYKGQLAPKEFARFLIGLATEYNQGLLIIENTGIGWSTVESVLEIGYKNVYYSPKGNNITAESYFDKFENNEVKTPGFTNSLRTRPLIISKFIEAVNEKSVTINSKRLLDEMKVFVWKNGRPEAQSGYNDDLVIPFGIGQYLRDTTLRYQQQTKDMTRAVLNNISRNDTPYQGAYYFGSGKDNPYSMPINNREREDFSWLVR